MIQVQAQQILPLLGRFRLVFPALALVLVILAAWLGWTGWQQVQDGTRRASVQQARDAVVAMTASTIEADFKRLEERLQSIDMRESLLAGDYAAATRVLSAGWPQLEAAEVVPVDLGPAYAELPAANFGRVAVLEAAYVEDRPVILAIRVDNAADASIALGAPIRLRDEVVALAFVRLAQARIQLGLDNAIVDDATYVALRHGGFTLHERGNRELADAAERMAVPVPGTGMRVVASVPYAPAGPFGMTGLKLFVLSLVLLALAALVWRLPVLLARKLAAMPTEDTEEGQLFADALAMPPQEEERRIVVADQPKAQPVNIDRSIFRAYDIRGVVGQTLDIGVAELIGHAIGSLMHERNLNDIVVGRDGRLSGPDLVAGLVQGLRKAGRNVIDIGLAPTPLVYFGAYHLRTGCCVAVTGSHNPPDYNGFKIVVGGETLSGEAIADLHTRLADGRLYVAPTPGDVSERDISDEYVERIASDVQLARPVKVVVDAGNGAAGELGPRVLEAIGAEVVQLYCDIDGTFPNHHPDPSEEENLRDLVDTVQRFNGELGIAFDGDGDRLGVVTASGENIFPDRLLMLFAADVLDRNPGAVIVYDVKCTGRLPGHILRHGGSPLMWKTGHSLIKAKMREVEAELAGEMSGHFFFAERWYGFDDGIYAAARLLEILALDPDTPEQVLQALPNGASTPEIKIQMPDGDPHGFVERFRERASFEGAQCSTIDGLRVDWGDGWGLIRASNTTPTLVLRFDADSPAALARIQMAFRTQLLSMDPRLPLGF